MKLLAYLLTSFAIFAAPAISAHAAGETPAAAPGQPLKLDPAKGQAQYGAVCAACHGADGNSTVPLQPKLAGQHPEYLVKQMLEFKDGKRNDPVMKGFASQLSEPDMRNIAAWLHSQQPKDGFAKDKNLVFIPMWNEFIGSDGKPNDSLYVEDKLHNNAEGYKIRTRIIKGYLEGK